MNTVILAIHRRVGTARWRSPTAQYLRCTGRCWNRSGLPTRNISNLVMLTLWDRSNAEPLSVKDIAALLQMDSATLSAMLKRLQAQGLIPRSRSTTDERTTKVQLTTRGRRLRQRALKNLHRQWSNGSVSSSHSSSICIECSHQNQRRRARRREQLSRPNSFVGHRTIPCQDQGLDPLPQAGAPGVLPRFRVSGRP